MQENASEMDIMGTMTISNIFWRLLFPLKNKRVEDFSKRSYQCQTLGSLPKVFRFEKRRETFKWIYNSDCVQIQRIKRYYLQTLKAWRKPFTNPFLQMSTT